jgi:hypothetical protein
LTNKNHLKENMSKKLLGVLLFGALALSCAAPQMILSIPDEPEEISGSLTGRWDGTWGSDDVREYLQLKEDPPGTISGTSAFEHKGGGASGYGRGVISGLVAGSKASFTLSRDGMSFSWVGSYDPARHVLRGAFNGYSNNATYTLEVPPPCKERQPVPLDGESLTLVPAFFYRSVGILWDNYSLPWLAFLPFWEDAKRA